jgi:alkylglycerol monooxygenase
MQKIQYFIQKNATKISLLAVLGAITNTAFAQNTAENLKTDGGNVYAWITPVVLCFVLLEVAVEAYYKRGHIRFQEAIANFGTAIANQTTNVLVAVGVYYAYGWLHQNYALCSIQLTWKTFPLLLIGLDFIFYWVHRWGHEINIFWAAHSPHHSAEEMNFCVALRASVTQRVMSFLFFWPLTLIGFQPMDIYMMSALHLFIAFLHHTEYVRKLGWIELVFTTPSHHRVHHGMNFRYLDKNFGEFLIIWDKLFGSFEEETEKVIYGMYHPPQSWNPIFINFHYYITLWRTAVAAPRWQDKFKIWFMPLTWQPEGMPPFEMPTEVTEQNQVRYTTEMYPNSRAYLILQVIFSLLLMLVVIKQDSPWLIWQRWLGAGLLWWSIINWAGIMERSTWTRISELLRIPITASSIILFSNFIEKPIYIILIFTISLFCVVWANQNFVTRSQS